MAGRHNIRKFTRAIVNADELALFINTGQVVGTMGPGPAPDRRPGDAFPGHRSSTSPPVATPTGPSCTSSVPGSTRAFTFGGRIDDVQDPQTGMIVTLRVFGDYSLQVKDPAALITNLVGTVDVADNERVTGWVSDQLLKVMRTQMTTQIVRNGWPILGLSAYTPDIEKAVIDGRQQPAGAPTAWPWSAWATSTSTCPRADEAQLKTLAKDTAYCRLAGGFNQYAAGEMALGAGQGMAKGGGGGRRRLPGRRPGLGGQAAAPAAARPAAAARARLRRWGRRLRRRSPSPAVECPSVPGRTTPPGAKFCASCGASMAPPTVKCADCQADNPPGAKFCSSCGTAIAPAGCTARRAGPRSPPGGQLLPVVRHPGRRPAPGGGQPPPAGPAPAGRPALRERGPRRCAGQGRWGARLRRWRRQGGRRVGFGGRGLFFVPVAAAAGGWAWSC